MDASKNQAEDPSRQAPVGAILKMGADAFSLVEVTIALGLVAYALLALLGLFVIGLSSSRESARETALAQIGLNAVSRYNKVNQDFEYNYEGNPVTVGNSNSYYKAAVVRVTPSSSTNSTNAFAYTGADLHLLKVSITSSNAPTLTNIVNAAKFLP